MVNWAKPAKLDLKQIHDYIARDSKFYAQKVSLEIVENEVRWNQAVAQMPKQFGKEIANKRDKNFC